MEERGTLSLDSLPEDAFMQEGARIMYKLHQILRKDILGLSDEEKVMTRYIAYNDNTNSENNDEATTTDHARAAASLLPDGLHVDTNNGHHFRHWTVLFYLDSCRSLGATTFPLAIPYTFSDSSSKSSLLKDLSCARKHSKEPLTEAQRAAQILIMEENVQHTKSVDASETCLELGRVIDFEALNLLRPQIGDFGTTTTGLRVIPRPGHICLFSSLTEDGYPNPLSFHGGEAMAAGETKEVLTFFYEVPVNFANRKEFGQRVRERERDLIDFHFE